jgi:hypothetical protein
VNNEFNTYIFNSIKYVIPRLLLLFLPDKQIYFLVDYLRIPRLRLSAERKHPENLNLAGNLLIPAYRLASSYLKKPEIGSSGFLKTSIDTSLPSHLSELSANLHFSRRI